MIGANMTEGRVLGLDWGRARIGIAISDGDRTVALGRETYERKDVEDDINYIRNLALKEEINLIVLGMPYHMDGNEGESAAGVREFRQALEENLDIPIETIDERLTSSEAERVMLESDLSREERKSHRDKLAATLILQRFLDREGS